MITPEFSIITPTYNCGRFVRRCHWSLFQQTRSNWEWIIVDDGSIDGTADIVAKLGDSRIRYFPMDRKSGPGAARNRAMVEARGGWLVMQDMDDLSFPTRLEQAHAARSQGYDFMCSHLTLIDDRYEVKGMRGWNVSRYPHGFVHATLCGRAEILREIGYPPCRSGEDQTMILHLANSYRGRFTSESLYIYHENASVSVSKAMWANYHTFWQMASLLRAGVLKHYTGVYRSMAACIMKTCALAIVRPLGTRIYAKTLRRRDGLSAAVRAELSFDQNTFIQQAAARFSPPNNVG